MSPAPPRWTADDLLDRYDAFAVDAYGVLVDGSGPIEHAAAFVRAIHRRAKRFLLVSNDASRLPATIAKRFATFGIDVPEDRVLASGMLIAPWLRERYRDGVRTIVLGPADSCALAEAGGARVVNAGDPDAACIIAADDDGFDFVPAVEATLHTITGRLERGLETALLLANPDLIYPKPGGKVGLTAGTVAAVIEGALQARFGACAPRFERLGKPFAPIFQTALARLGVAASDRVCMLGDQIDTDIKGAQDAGIDGVLVETGVGRLRGGDAVVPTAVLRNLALLSG